MAELPLDQAIPRFKQNESRVDRFANGADNENWQTSGGTAVPSLQKFLKDKNDQIDSAVETVYAAADRAEGAADEAAASAASISIPTFDARYVQKKTMMRHVNLFDHMTYDQRVAYQNHAFVAGGRASLQAAIDALPNNGGRLIVPEPGILYMDEKNPIEIESRGVGPNNIRIVDKNDWTIEGNGMVITTRPGANNTSIFWVHRCAGFEISGITGIADNTGLTPATPSQANGLLFAYSVRDFYVHDLTSKGFQGSHIVGNYQFRGLYENIEQEVPNYASGFDIASWQDMTVSRHRVRGSGAVSQGFQHIYDEPNNSVDHPGYNETGLFFREGRSNNIRYQDCHVTDCQTGVKFADVAGDVYIEGGSIFNNAGPNGDYWCGVLFQTSAEGIAKHGGAGVSSQNLNIMGTDIYSNGRPGEQTGFNGGVFINSNFSPVHVHIHPGTKIHDNAAAGIVVFGAAAMLRAQGVDFEARFGDAQLVHIRNPQGLVRTVNAKEDKWASRITDCRGVNPQGFVGDIHTAIPLPAGTGLANRRFNTNPYPCMVYISGGSGVAVRDARNDHETVLAGDPKQVLLQPGDSIFFTGTLPSVWHWYGC